MSEGRTLCIHWWVIPAPDPEHGSRLLKGRCRRCRAIRTFDVHAEDGARMWGSTTLTAESRARAGQNGGEANKRKARSKARALA